MVAILMAGSLLAAGCEEAPAPKKSDAATGTAQDATGGGGGGAGGSVDASGGTDVPATDGPAAPGDGAATGIDGAGMLGMGADASVAAVCGNGVLETGELCDPAATGPTRCPDVCPVQMCMTRKLVNAGTCQAQCMADTAQTTCANGDGCCPSSCNANNDDDCKPVCGNSIKEPGETCDPLGNCPQSCPRERCEFRMLTGAGTCQAECKTVRTETACMAGDGCCPAGCNSSDDSDCDPACGNGILEPGETCDPKTNAAACPQTREACGAIGCQQRTWVNGGTCKAACMPAENTTTCANGDGCCPPGCNNTNDNDCQAACGNGIIEKDELCEPGTAKECPTSCPTVACTIQQVEGADKCHSRCVAAGTIKECKMVSDGCCPEGCSANTDADCTARCGNGVTETGETCDSTCQADSDKCRNTDNFNDLRIGTVTTCTFVCHPRERECVTGDGFCPSKCRHVSADPLLQDSDCKKLAGDMCTAASECAVGLGCADGFCCSQICDRCQNCNDKGLCEDIKRGPDVTANNPCEGDNICLNGSCFIQTGRTGCVEHIDCEQNACEDECTPGGSCIKECQEQKCDPGTRRTPAGCRAIEGSTCATGDQCASGLCDTITDKCVLSCGPNQTMVGTLAAGAVCKVIDGHPCLALGQGGPSSCVSGLCEKTTGLCVADCLAGSTEATDGYCKLVAGQACLDLPANCHSGLCDNLNTPKKCVDACQMFESEVGGFCIKLGEDQSCLVNMMPVPQKCLSGLCDGASGLCRNTCAAGKGAVAMGPTAGVCLILNDFLCDKGSDCLNSICELRDPPNPMQQKACTSSCPDTKVVVAGVCRSLNVGEGCMDDPKKCGTGICDDGLCATTCDAHEFVDPFPGHCRKLGIGASCFDNAMSVHIPERCDSGFCDHATSLCVAGCGAKATVNGMCLIKDGDTCTAEPTDCEHEVCEQPENKCRTGCPADKAIVNKVCRKLDVGESCQSTPSKCATNLCRQTGGLCTDACTTSEYSEGNFCKPKFDNNTSCMNTPTRCLSGKCDGATGNCVGTCDDDTEVLDANGFCKRLDGKTCGTPQHNCLSGACAMNNKCKLSVGAACTMNSQCASEKCPVPGDGGAAQVCVM